MIGNFSYTELIYIAIGIIVLLAIILIALLILKSKSQRKKSSIKYNTKRFDIDDDFPDGAFDFLSREDGTTGKEYDISKNMKAKEIIFNAKASNTEKTESKTFSKSIENNNLKSKDREVENSEEKVKYKGKHF